MKILITTTSFQDTSGQHHDLLEIQNWDVDYLRGPIDDESLAEIIHQYDGVLCGDDNFNKRVLEIGKRGKLKVLSKYGVGLDSIDLVAAAELGITVVNVPGVNQTSVSEHVLALLFTFQKNIHIQYNSVRDYSWNRLIGKEVHGSTFGIIGLGSVGKELAKKCIALGMQVIVHDLIKDTQFLNEHIDIHWANDVS